MRKELYMLSPYITICYIVYFFLKKDEFLTLFTPITWFISVVGILILLYKRYILNDPVRYFGIKKIMGINTDFLLILGKIVLIGLLLKECKPVSFNSITFAVLIIMIYLNLVDIRYVYGI